MDYGRVLASLDRRADPKRLGAALLAALADDYESVHGDSALHEFEQSGAVYLFDLASSADLQRQDRTVAAWTVTPESISRRDAAFQRGFPMAPGPSDAAVDRGHLIPHLSGGQLGPSIFRQDRALNRGWSEAGRRYRSLKREVATTPGGFYLGHLIYTDATDYPSAIEIGLLRTESLHVERFDNRPSVQRETHDGFASITDEHLALALLENGIRVVALSEDGTFRFLDGIKQLHHIVYVESLEKRAYADAVEELEALLNDSESPESAFQHFFERYPRFLTGQDYSAAHPHVALSSVDRSPLIPDFVLAPTNAGQLCDLLELKLPSARIIVGKGERLRLSAALLEAAAQLREYRDYFESAANRKLFRDSYGLNAFRPRMFVVIGRRGSVDPMAFRRAEEEVPFLTLRTYDDLLDRVTKRAALQPETRRRTWSWPLSEYESYDERKFHNFGDPPPADWST